MITAFSGKSRPTDFPDGDLGLEDISKEAFSYQSIKRHGLSLVRKIYPFAGAPAGSAQNTMKVWTGRQVQRHY